MYSIAIIFDKCLKIFILYKLTIIPFVFSCCQSLLKSNIRQKRCGCNRTFFICCFLFQIIYSSDKSKSGISASPMGARDGTPGLRRGAEYDCTSSVSSPPDISDATVVNPWLLPKVESNADVEAIPPTTDSDTIADADCEETDAEEEGRMPLFGVPP